MSDLNLVEEQEHFCSYIRSNVLDPDDPRHYTNGEILAEFGICYNGWLMAMRACFDEGWRKLK